MTGFLLQVGGPMQSWGEHSSFNDRDTVSHPTRSGLIGMIASALGIPREDAVTAAAEVTGADVSSTRFGQLGALRFTIRHDRPGTRLRDFHTIGGGLPAHRTVPTAKGGRRSPGLGTIVSERHYLADAVFTIAVTAAGAPDAARLTAACAQALAAPHWPLHLGRRSCPPGAVFVLATDIADPVADLLTAVPLARPRPGRRPGQASAPPAAPDHADEAGPSREKNAVSVRFTADAAFEAPFPPSASSRAQVTTLNDEPLSMRPRARVHRSRPSYTTSCPLSAALCAGYGADYLDAVLAYRAAAVTQERNTA
ncbi:type I-E CRISPR-associated protein Cas5/CasD [Streptomyces sp. NPDC003717]|uniref:type I-E CRISPR-associated protein Cas5/CasD n=1 Tax=Streptomyces sp. NPDC003717 TaxID=3154276 RepID=UPI0033A94A21